MSRFAKPSELLGEIDSHEIVAASILDDCDFDTECVPRFTKEVTLAKIEGRGLGGWLADEPGDVIYGWMTAEALARKSLGTEPGGMFQGRGSIFRACKKALEGAGL